MNAKLRRNIAVVVLLCMSLLILNFTVFAAPVEAGVYFIALAGKGNATLVKTISGSNASYGLVDTGGSLDYATYVEPYLTTILGSTKLSFIAFSHLDGDHEGGALSAIASFADSNTSLYIKDVANANSSDDKEALIGTRANDIINAAKAKSMPVCKIKPYETFDSDVASISDIRSISSNKFKAKIEKFTKNAQGNYVSVGMYDSITFGKFTMTWYNGNNWNGESVIPGGWGENVNSSPLLLKCTTSTGTNFRTLLASDLGANGDDYYNAEIAKRVHQIVGNISVYQVAHHGYYKSILPDSIASTINPKYAVVTNSYNEIVNTSYEKYNVTDPTPSDLSIATSTLKETLKSTALLKMYFLSGKGGGNDNRIIDALVADNYALLNWTGSTIKSGNVSFEFAASDPISAMQ